VALVALVCLAGFGGSSKKGLVPIGAGLDGPAGAHATVYARGLPLVSAFAFDGRGRLWATASGASTHTRDGVFLVRPGKAPVKAAYLRGPLGLVWVGKNLYVSTLAGVVELGGLQGTHFTSKKTILSGPSTGENNNLVRAPDGRLVLGISAPCDHCRPASKWAGAIVSFGLDGDGLRLYAGRIRAPYGLAFYPGTSDLYASMNQRDDLGSKTPGDWLALVRPGESWGFPGCYGQGGSVCAGVPKPVGVLDPHAAAGGVAFLTSGGYAPSAVVPEWNRAKVMRVDLETRKVTPLLTGLDNPLPAVTTSGGALLVGDWGSGEIYRVVLP